jgi:hypothetical protein
MRSRTIARTEQQIRGPAAALESVPIVAPMAAWSTARASSSAPIPCAGLPEPAIGSSARYAWAILIARSDAVFPLLCLRCGGRMPIIAFSLDGGEVRKILDQMGEDAQDHSCPWTVAVGSVWVELTGAANGRYDQGADILAAKPEMNFRHATFVVQDRTKRILWQTRRPGGQQVARTLQPCTGSQF